MKYRIIALILVILLSLYAVSGCSKNIIDNSFTQDSENIETNGNTSNSDGAQSDATQSDATQSDATDPPKNDTTKKIASQRKKQKIIKYGASFFYHFPARPILFKKLLTLRQKLVIM